MNKSQGIDGESYPESVFRALAEILQKQGFWFDYRKYEVVSNIRVTQRISKNDNYISLNFYLSNEIIQKLAKQQIKNSYNIDQFSGFNENIESNQNLPNWYRYQKEDSKDY